MQVGWLTVLAVVFGLWILGSLTSHREKTGSTDNQPPTNGINVSAADLIDEYKANEVSADERYKHQALAVTGIVDSIGKDILDNLYVTLNDGGKYEFTKVQCMFGEDHKSELASLNKGVQIRVVGICHGKLGNVLLRECSIRP
jgi:hypothetical protein